MGSLKSSKPSTSHPGFSPDKKGGERWLSKTTAKVQRKMKKKQFMGYHLIVSE